MIALIFYVAVLKAAACLLFSIFYLWLEPSLFESRLPVYLSYVVLNGCMGVLLYLGGTNRSAVREFGVLFLLIASPYAGASVSVVQRTFGLDAFDIFLHFQIDAFAPYVFWKFAEAYPAAPIGQRRLELLRYVRPLALLVGVGLVAANLLLFFDVEETIAGLNLFSRFGYPSFYWPIVFLVLIGAIVFLLSRIRGSNPIARRRLAFLALSVAIGVAPMLVITIAHNVSEVAREFFLSPSREPLTFLFVDLFMLSLPITCGYSLLAHRVFSLRYVITTGARYLLLRYLAIVVIIAPFLAIGYLLFSARELTIADFVDHHLIVLILLVVSGAVAWRYRELMERWIDEMFLRNTFDLEREMVSLSSLVVAAKSPAEFSIALSECVGRALNSREVTLLLRDDAGCYKSTNSRTALQVLDEVQFSSLLADDQLRDFSLDLEALNPNVPEQSLYWLLDNDVVVLARVDEFAWITLSAKTNFSHYTPQELAFLKLVCRTISSKASEFVENTAPQEIHLDEVSVCPSCLTVVVTDSNCPLCGTVESKPLELPQMVGGKYQLVKQIGAGSYGVVFLGRDVALERDVAIKTLPVMSVQQALELKRESKTMAQLSHQNLAAIYGVETYKGKPMIVMEFFERGTLRDVMNLDQELDQRLAVFELLDAVEFIHRQGLIHRDIKPDNVGVSRSGSVKLMDFGLGRFLEQRIESIEEAGRSLSGTVAYLPPEAFSIGANDRHVDIWALAVLVHELITGLHPFEGETTQDTLKKIMFVGYEPPSSISFELKQCFVSAFAKEPSGRPENVQKLRELLIPAIAAG